jgi:hypothetical protein
MLFLQDDILRLIGKKGFPGFDRSVSFYELTGGFSGGSDQTSEKAKCIQGAISQK